MKTKVHFTFLVPLSYITINKCLFYHKQVNLHVYMSFQILKNEFGQNVVKKLWRHFYWNIYETYISLISYGIPC